MSNSLFPELDRPLGTFHQRNAMPADDVERGKKSAQSQEEVILAWFKAHPQSRLTPPEVMESIGLRCPLTSVRRALTNLTKQGLLTKHEETQRMGPYGMHNCTWGLA